MPGFGRPAAERLEDRTLLTTTLYLDFGGGVGMGNTMSATVNEFKNIFGPGLASHGGSFGTGSDMSDGLGMVLTDTMTFRPLGYDYDGNGILNNADITALANAVVPIIQRALEPFDIDVVVAASANLAQAAAVVAQNSSATNGQNDAYNFIMDIRSPRFGGGSVGDNATDPHAHEEGHDSRGDNTGLYGIAAADDLYAQFFGGPNRNLQDEATLVFADTIFNDTTGGIGTAAFNQNLAYRIAYTATHEAFHTLSAIHTTGLTASGDMIRRGSVTRDKPFMVTRFDITHDDTVAEPNNYLLMAGDPDIGLRDANVNGRPDLAYVTGTGAHDRITLTAGAGSVVNVLVQAYSNAARTTLIGQESYTIDLATETDGEILIDGGINADEIIIDARIATSFRVRGGTGLDGTAVEADRVSVLGNGETGSFVVAPGGGTFTIAGTRTIAITETETVVSSGFSAPVAQFTAGPTSANEGSLVTYSGRFTDVDGAADLNYTYAWTVTSNNGQIVPGASGTVTSYTTFGVVPNFSFTPADNGTYVISLVVTDKNGLASAAVTRVLTVANVAPTASDFSISTPEDVVLNGSIGATDAPGDTLSYTLATLPANGGVVLNGSTGGFTYSPIGQFNGTDGFSVVVTDDDGATRNVTVSITVTAVNDPPVAGDDLLDPHLRSAGVLTIPFSVLLLNDSKGPVNESGQFLTITSVSNAVGGTVSINGTNVLFTPAAGFLGAASFDYVVRDNGTTNGVAAPLTDVGRVTFDVNALSLQVDILSDEDDGNGALGDLSLREAVKYVADGGTITFAASLSGGTILLGGSEIVLNRSVTIAGLGASRLTVSGNDLSRVFFVGPLAFVEISGLTVRGGNTLALGGGIANSGSLSLRDSLVLGNRVADGAGGGIANFGALTVLNSTLAGNIAGGVGGTGGGIYNSGALTLINSTLSGNWGVASGGGLANADGDASLRNVTLYGNRSGSALVAGGPGGGISTFNVGTAFTTLYNTLVIGNLRSAGGGIWVASDFGNKSVVAASSNNPVGHAGSGGGLLDGVNGNIVGANAAAVIDPVLRNNGGTTPTHVLVAGGAAVNAGSNAQALGPIGTPLGTDQRGFGFARLFDGRVDIGAFETNKAVARDDLSGFLGSNWWVGISNGTTFQTALWASWGTGNWLWLGQADFNGDGRQDVYGFNDDGRWRVGISDGTAYRDAAGATWADVAWEQVLVGDLNGDGRDDILAQRDTGAWWGALATATGYTAPKIWLSGGSRFRDYYLVDMTGDGKADFVEKDRSPSRLIVSVGISNGTTFLAPEAWLETMNLGPDADFRLGDFNGDGRTDLFRREPWSGLAVSLSTGTGFANAEWGNFSEIWEDLRVGDFDGNGMDDLVVRTSGIWQVFLSNGTAFTRAKWDIWAIRPWLDVRVGDFNGDGRDDIAGRDIRNWWVGLSTGTSFSTTHWGTWSEGNWRAVDAASEDGGVPRISRFAASPIAPSAAPAGGRADSAPAAAAVAGPRSLEQEPLRLFWSQADEDDEFSGRLLAV